MAIVPSYKNDIFVSYLHRDDVPVSSDIGWVSSFVHRIEDSLDQRFGRAGICSLWMRRSLPVNEHLSAGTMDAVQNSAILLVMMSPAYLRSMGAGEEATAFLKSFTDKQSELRRILVVEVQPTERSHWPPSLHNVTSLRLWDQDTCIMFPEDGEQYHESLLALVRRITDLLKQLASETSLDFSHEEPSSISIGFDNGLSEDQKRKLNRRREQNDYDVFLCHNSKDKPAARRIANLLMQQDILPWLDEVDLRPGLSWQKSLEEQIDSMKSAAVLVGGSGFGPWQDMELDAFLRAFVKKRVPVIPVLIEDCQNVPTLPTFLSAMHWVDFRKEEPNPVAYLIWGITGVRPAD